MKTGLTTTDSGDLLRVSQVQASRELDAWFEINEEQTAI